MDKKVLEIIESYSEEESPLGSYNGSSNMLSAPEQDADDL